MLFLSSTFRSFLSSNEIKLIAMWRAQHRCLTAEPMSPVPSWRPGPPRQRPGMAGHLLGAWRAQPWLLTEVWQHPGVPGLWASAQQEPVLPVPPVAKSPMCEGRCPYSPSGEAQGTWVPDILQREHREQQHCLINLNNLNWLFFWCLATFMLIKDVLQGNWSRSRSFIKP